MTAPDETAARQIRDLGNEIYLNGYAAGVKAGIKTGYAAARSDLFELMRQLQPPAELSEPGKLGKPKNAAKARDGGLAPYLQRAIDYVAANPGTTSWQAKAALSQGTLYNAAKRGLVRREGSQFYPLNADGDG